MPRLTGPGLARELRLDLPDLPILYLSGYPREDAAGHGDDIPNGNFLQKPFERAVFLERLRNLLAEVELR